MYTILLFIVLTFTSKIFASPPPCSAWQTTVNSHHVKKHQRGNAPSVSSYDKKTFCREKYLNADFWGPKLKNTSVWKSKELLKVLQVLSTLPSYLKLDVDSFERQKTSEVKNNPASSDMPKKAIVLYDLFFKKSITEQKLIISHELAHFLYLKLSKNEQKEFVELAVWKLGAINLTTRKVDLIQPNKLLKVDSAVNPEEDFANHIEVLISNPTKIKQHNPNIYNFLTKRFFK